MQLCNLLHEEANEPQKSATTGQTWLLLKDNSQYISAVNIEGIEEQLIQQGIR